MAEVTASIFQEKLDNFLTSVEIVAEQKIPAWFRPFMDTVKEFAMNVNDFFDQFHMIGTYRPEGKPVYDIHDPTEIRYLFQLT